MSSLTVIPYTDNTVLAARQRDRYKWIFWFSLLILNGGAACVAFFATKLGTSVTSHPSFLSADPKRMRQFAESVVIGWLVLKSYRLLSYKRIQLAPELRFFSLLADVLTALYAIGIAIVSTQTQDWNALSYADKTIYIYACAMAGVIVFGYMTIRYFIAKFQVREAKDFNYNKFVEDALPKVKSSSGDPAHNVLSTDDLSALLDIE